MLKYVTIYITILISGLCCTSICAQVKFENESRMRRKDVPSRALQFVDSLKMENEVKWYLEKGIDKNSIEAKFKRKKKKCSIEFDTLGNIEDVELEITVGKLSTQIKDSLCFQLQNNCLKSKIVKIQIQFSGSRSALMEKLKTTETSPLLTIKYEIVVRCDSKKNVELFEFLISDVGELLSKTKIILKNSSHLEY